MQMLYKNLITKYLPYIHLSNDVGNCAYSLPQISCISSVDCMPWYASKYYEWTGQYSVPHTLM